jgi:hypothetical protein
MSDWMFFKKIDINVTDQVTGATELYLRRWVIFRTPWGQLMLHKILKPDPDRELHDHPWSFRALILKGGYYEIVQRFPKSPAYVRYHETGNVNNHTCYDWHRIDCLRDNKPAWTLVLTGKKQKSWSFLVEGKPMPWHEFLKMKGMPVQSDLQDDW